MKINYWITKIKNRKVMTFLFAAYSSSFVMFWLAASASAADEGGHGNGGDILWRIINFVILAGAIFLIARYIKIKDFFANRREAIRAELEAAQNAKEEAEKKFKEFESKLNLLNKKIEEVYREIRTEGELEKKRIIEEAMQAAEKLKDQARHAAEQEIKKARQEIKVELARIAVEMAEEILRHELTAADHERLIKEYLEKVRVH